MSVTETSYGIVPLQKKQGRLYILLILHRSGKHWAFPKGHPEEGESPIESAQRELKEETNLSIESFISQEAYVESYTFQHDNNWIDKKVLYYPAFVSGELKVQEEEILEYKWLELSEALETITFEESKKILRKVAADHFFS